MSTTLDTTHDSTHVDELRLLEAEAVHIIREVVAELTKPVLLFSAGKDSIVLLRLAEKAFRPAPLPFPVLHVDTGHNFDEVIAFRDRRVSEQGHTLIVGSVQETIDAGRVADPGPGASRNRQQTRTLLDALEVRGIAREAVAVHFHDTYGQALSNTMTALRQGVAIVDASAGGLGGCPYAKSATGNLATEDLVWALHGAGVETGVDLESLVATSAWMAEQLGRPSPSRVVRALTGSS